MSLPGDDVRIYFHASQVNQDVPSEFISISFKANNHGWIYSSLVNPNKQYQGKNDFDKF